MTFFGKTCLFFLLVIAVDIVMCLDQSCLQPGDRTLLQNVIRKCGGYSEVATGLMNQVEQFVSAVASTAQDFESHAKSIEQLLQKVDSISKEVAEIKATQNVVSKMAQETNKRMGDMANRSTERLNRLEGSVIRNISISIEDVKTATDEKWKAVESSLAEISETFGKPNWTTSLQKSLKHIHNVKKSWYIENIAERVRNAEDGDVWLHGEQFVIADYTAKFIVSFKVRSGELWIGLFLSLCPGVKDSLLQWPFQIPYTLAINHPKGPEKNAIGIVTLKDLTKRKGEFKKPLSDCNVGYGNHYFRSWQFVRSEGFVEDNAITVSVMLHPGEASWRL